MDYLIVYSSYPYEKIRIGKKNDGGYIICNGIKNDILISCGISNDISFEDEFSKKEKIKCYAFDGTINNIPNTNNSDIKWIKKNISGKNTETTTNLKEYITEYKNIFLKMDIESYEFDWLRDMTEEELSHISQMTIEFHFPFIDTSKTNIPILDKNVENASEKIECLQKIAQTHYLVHFHGNNCCGTIKYENIEVPNVFECTYVRKDYFINKPFRNVISIPDSRLDFSNIKNKQDIILKNYPFVDKKTIIFTMTHKTRNRNHENKLENIWGLGDILRGMISLYKYAEKNNYYFHIDAQNHILNKYLEIKENPYKEFIVKNSSNIDFVLDNDIDKYMEQHNKNEPIYIYTNMFIRDKMVELDKKYFKENFLKPKIIIEKKIDELIKDLIKDNVNNNYDIIHVRLKDTDFVFNNKDKDKYEKIYKKIKKYINNNTILVTSSRHFKSYIQDNYKAVKQFKTTPAHIGYGTSDENNIIDTLCEYFIMTKAKKIYTYSDYSWVSGFVQSINLIFDVPILDIKS